MIITCPQCGFSRDAPQDKLPQGSVIARCPQCGCRFRFSVKDGVGEIIPARTGHTQEEQEEDIRVVASNAYAAEQQRYENERKAEARAAWLEASRNPWATAPEPDGWLGAFYQTVIRVMFQAPQFFGALRPETNVWRPLAFFLIICVIQILVERAWGQVLLAFLLPEAGQDPQLQNLLRMLAPETSAALAVLLRSGVLLLQLFIFALLMYLVYRILAPGRASFSLVWQALAYSASPWLLCIIPGIGSLAGSIWGIGCLAIGCKTMFKLTWAQTLAGFLPIIALFAPFIAQIGQIFS